MVTPEACVMVNVNCRIEIGRSPRRDYNLLSDGMSNRERLPLAGPGASLVAINCVTVCVTLTLHRRAPSGMLPVITGLARPCRDVQRAGFDGRS